eukprot:scaffold5671_cov64-Cylindrotheca_fusiformis.AAC.1
MAAAKVEDATNETTEKPGDKQDVFKNSTTTPVTWNSGWTSASTTTKTRASASIQSTPAAQPTPVQAVANEPHYPHHIRNGRNGGVGLGLPLMLASQPTPTQEAVAAAAAAKATQPQQQVNVLTPTPPKHTDKPSTKQDILHPHPHDVLFGRGLEPNKHHPGNVHWRKMVKANRAKYSVSPKAKKVTISRSLVKAVRSQNPPGRFLQKAFCKDSKTYK